jgi:hypothetical protein
MDQDLDRIVEGCLAAAELSADDERDAQADAAFARLFAVLEPPRPSPGFARAVVERVRRERLLSGRRDVRARWKGWAVPAAAIAAVVLVVDALFVAWQPAVVVETWAAVVTLAVRATLALLDFLAPAIGLWNVGVSVGSALVTAMATREASFALTVALIAAALAFAAIQRMLFSEEESSPW